MAVSLRDVVSFGRYEPLFRIASGGMAEVYAARIQGEAGFQKLVAVKRMHPHLANDAAFVDMFLNEARLAANVASPFVVQTMDLGRGTDGSLYIVMELVVGLSLIMLERHLKKEPFPPAIAIEVIAQAAQGIDDAHEATTPAGDPLGLIHRDVSPHNILLGLDGRARVTDFGIARAVHRPREETNVKELKGKFAYMSPEQTRLRAVDRRTDVFSLGIVCWELLVGRRLFAERDATACIRNVRGREIPPPHKLNPNVPPELSGVVLRALERDRDKRTPTAAVLNEELRHVGRDVFGKLPTRRQIAQFVRETGGEELERLQRLIRLGTDGAAPEQIEEIRPGVTQILSGDASGIAVVGEQPRGTERLDENAPLIPSVVLPPEDDARTAHYMASGDPEPLHALDSGETTRILHATTAPKTQPSFKEYSGGPPTEVDPRSETSITRGSAMGANARLFLGAFGVMIGAILLGIVLALVFLDESSDEHAVPLPIEPPVVDAVEGPVAEPGETRPATRAEVAPNPEAVAQTELVAGPEEHVSPEADDAGDDSDREDDDEAERSAGMTAAERRRRWRRRRTHRTTTGQPSEPANNDLLDLGAFDRHQR